MKSLPQSAGPPPDDEATSMACQEIDLKPKFEIYGEEVIDKCVKQSGKSGRIYLPPEWVGKNVKVVRLD